MGWKARQWASKQHGLPPRAKAVLLCIAEYHNEKAGYAWPSQQRIADDTGYSTRTVKRAIIDLQSLGLLTSARQKFSFHEGYAPNRYYLVGYSPKQPTPRKVYRSGGWFNSAGEWEPDLNQWDPT